MKLLIIEDDVDLCAILKKGFIKKGYLVDPATDGLEGDELAFVNVYNLIILDLNLPNIDGLEILKHIRGDKQSGSDARSWCRFINHRETNRPSITRKVNSTLSYGI